MTRGCRVVWSQGTFLQPHHFQQLERTLRFESAQSMELARSRAWGCSRIAFDPRVMREGQIALTQCEGRFPDGTIFAAPAEDMVPSPITISGAHVGKTLYLGLPLRVQGQDEFVPLDAVTAATRFSIERITLADDTDSEADPVEVEVGRLRMHLLLGDAATQGYSCIPLAVIASLDNDGVVTLSDTFVPTVLIAQSLPFFRDMVRDIHSRLLVRARNMSGRSVASGRLAATEHFLEATTLMAMNRYLPVFDELARGAEVHPFELYILCAQAAGELSTFASVTAASPRFEPYRHQDLYATFAPVLRVLYDALGQVIAQSATQIALEYVNFGIYLGRFPDARLVTRGNQFVLCVHSEMHPEELRERFPSVSKVAPPGRIKELVNSLVPGVPMRLLSSAPPEIRFPSSRSIYFELDSSSGHWTEMRSGFAIHVADEFPSLRMELWVISSDHGAR